MQLHIFIFSVHSTSSFFVQKSHSNAQGIQLVIICNIALLHRWRHRFTLFLHDFHLLSRIDPITHKKGRRWYDSSTILLELIPCNLTNRLVISSSEVYKGGQGYINRHKHLKFKLGKTRIIPRNTNHQTWCRLLRYLAAWTCLNIV